VEKVIAYGNPKQINLVGTATYPRSSWLTQKRYIGHSKGRVVKHKEVVDKKVKEWKRVVEVPELPESLPRFTVKTRLVAVFDDGSRQVVFDETTRFDLSGGGE
jgi:hypothetical protein